MADLRGAVAYVLSERGFVVNLSEANDFAISGNMTALEECFNLVRQSDYYLLIVGERTGSWYDESASISVTHQEYRVAKASYLSTGRPVPLLFVRRHIDALLEEHSISGVSASTLDHPEALKSFLTELRADEPTDMPNWLYSFDDFRDIMDTLSVRLRLGRDLTATLAIHDLIGELEDNLTHLVSRMGQSVFPRHFLLERARARIAVSVDDAARRIDLPRDDANLLIEAVISRQIGSRLSTRAMLLALSSGVFLEWDVSAQKLVAGTRHRAVRALAADCDALRSHGEGSPWSTELGADIAAANFGQRSATNVSGFGAAMALGFGNVMENVWNGHVALLANLLGKPVDPLPIARIPATPYGEKMAAGIKAESVEGFEIEKLILNDVHPFGSVMTPELVEHMKETESLNRFVEQIRHQLQEQGVPAERIEDVNFTEIVANVLSEMQAAPEALIERRERL